MSLQRRWTGPLGASLLFALIIALVVGGLGSVTHAALAIEAEHRDAIAQAERTSNIRLALWRMDGLFAPSVGLENSRDWLHYSALYTVDPVLKREGAKPGPTQLPSPLLSADLPAWMVLHVRFDFEHGWSSPQVPDVETAERLGASMPALNLANATPERRERLARLQRVVPGVKTALGFAARLPDSKPFEPTSLGKPGSPSDLDGIDERRSIVHPELAAERPEAQEVHGWARSHRSTLPANDGGPGYANNRNDLGGAQQPRARSQNLDANDEFARRKLASEQGRSGQTGTAQSPTPQSPEFFNTNAGGLGNNAANEEPAPGTRRANPTVPVLVGAMQPDFLTTAEGEPLLCLMRPVFANGTTEYQGVLLDEPLVLELLKEQVVDLFPEAVVRRLEPGVEANSERTMSALPMVLDPGTTVAKAAGLTPLRVGLLLAWAAAGLALAAVGFGGRALLDLSERRIRFISAVTHELRTPLTTLRLYLDLLTSGLIEDPDQRSEYLNTLARESDRLNRLVENVLDFARLERTRGKADLMPFPVAELAATLSDTWAARCKADGKELILHDLSQPGTLLKTDPRLAEQILGNLIDNARKYSANAADPRIWVRFRPAGETATAIEVEDRGPGVPPAERGRIFRPFRRGDAADAVGGGAGLGLALAKRWAEMLHGTLSYRIADDGRGACFRLVLPAYRLGSGA